MKSVFVLFYQFMVTIIWWCGGIWEHSAWDDRVTGRRGWPQGRLESSSSIPYPKVQALHDSHSFDPHPSKPPEPPEPPTVHSSHWLLFLKMSLTLLFSLALIQTPQQRPLCPVGLEIKSRRGLAFFNSVLESNMLKMEMKSVSHSHPFAMVFSDMSPKLSVST